MWYDNDTKLNNKTWIVYVCANKDKKNNDKITYKHNNVQTLLVFYQ